MTATPQAAVTAWWQAMKDRDPQALSELVLPDYLSSGGPAGRSVGRFALITEATAFFAQARIDEWAVDAMEVRQYGDAAVCSYVWSETGVHLGAPFTMRGLATDVLVRRDHGWRHLAHHVSPLPHTAGDEVG
ncbi:nuclear transport factor 2 family protein [Streptosporangium sp. NPDC004379]|uniref:nuclear transport factor 2 family protein n=1 Tax=Streptosporangium sp. NPDC004379 TaxID=3366189 RepID=UPI003677B08E